MVCTLSEGDDREKVRAFISCYVCIKRKKMGVDRWGDGGGSQNE